MRVFFCHASEDKAVVGQVFKRVSETYPDIKGWMDSYEIVGGDDLLEKIAEGIEEADKFLVFLSERSIKKPWVKAELRKALMAEIEGVKSSFIIPVKIGAISKVPAFIESKLYVDLESQTEDEWLAEIYAATTGIPAGAAPDAEENLRVTFEPTADEPTAVAIVFEARFWAEPIAFAIETTEPIIERAYQLLPPQKGGTLGYAVREGERDYAVALPEKRIKPGQRFAMLLKFAEVPDMPAVINSVARWDGAGSTQSGIAFLA